MRQNPSAIGSRSAAALIGGYLSANALSIALSVTLPSAQDDAVVIGMMATFLWYSAAILWAFSAKTALRAWLGLLLITAASAAVWAASMQLGANP